MVITANHVWIKRMPTTGSVDGSFVRTDFAVFVGRLGLVKMK